MLNTKQRKFIPEYLKTGCIRTTCDKLGIHETTYFKWRENQEFIAELKKQLDELYNSSLNELKMISSEAIIVLKGLLNSDIEVIKLRAASTILDNLHKFSEKKEFNLSVVTKNNNTNVNTDVKEFSDEELEEFIENLGYKRV